MLILQSLNELLDVKDEGPYISLYQPTHRQHPDNKQDAILFRNLVKQVEASLAANLSKRGIADILAPFHKLAADTLFWNHTLDGLAVFAAAGGFFAVMHIQRPTAELAVVADSFHIKPLLRVFQSADRFQVLGISRQAVRLFEGNRDGLREIELGDDVPATATDVIGDDLPEPVSRVRSGSGAPDRAGNTGIRYSHGAKSDVIDQQTERFFREVDRAVDEHHSKPSRLPLILAALPEHHAMFRKASHNPALLDHGVEINPDALGVEELRTLAWKIMEPVYLERLASFVDQFNAARNVQQASADLSDVAAAAVAGRVRILLLEADRNIPGSLDGKTGAIRFAEGAGSQVDDLLDDLGEQVLYSGGEVIIVPAQRMPAESGLAAIYRY